MKSKITRLNSKFMGENSLMLQGHKVILSSVSPRRRELLSSIGIDFTVDTETSFVEHVEPGTAISDTPLKMAEGKSAGFHRALEDNEILITSDTVVFCGETVMGKPHSRDEAVRMLRQLSGKTHSVTTAVCIRSNARRVSFSDTALVTFENLSDDEIFYYIDNYKPYDKAGAYGIQEWIGLIGISKIEGSFYTIMGLPIQRVYAELQKFLEA